MKTFPLNETLLRRAKGVSEEYIRQEGMASLMQVIADLPFYLHDLGNHFFCNPDTCEVFVGWREGMLQN